MSWVALVYLGRPESGREDLYTKLDAIERQLRMRGEIQAEVIHGIGGQSNVLEHSLELGGELVAALGLQRVDRVVRVAHKQYGTRQRERAEGKGHVQRTLSFSIMLRSVSSETLLPSSKRLARCCL